MFEQFNVPALYLGCGPALSLYASGRTTGIVLDSGEDNSTVVPVYEGHPLWNASGNRELAGRMLTADMQKLLTERGNTLGKFPERGLREFKERFGYVALDFEQEMQTAASSSSLEQTYELPDGTKITAGVERFRCPEALFRPSLVGMELSGIDEALHGSILKCKVELCEQMYGNIVLSGGSSLFAGLAERIRKEMIALAPSTMRVNVIASPERRNLPWIGASVLGSLSTFQQMWIPKEEYDGTR